MGVDSSASYLLTIYLFKSTHRTRSFYQGLQEVDAQSNLLIPITQYSGFYPCFFSEVALEFRSVGSS